MKSIAACWKSITEWYRLNALDWDRSLPGPASTADLERIDAEFGIALPADLKESYLLHDGTGGWGWFPYGPYMLSAAEVVKEGRFWCDAVKKGAFKKMKGTPEGPIKRTWWNPLWIPFTSSGSGDHYCVDLDPARGGTVGQVIEFFHETSASRVVAPSFAAWLDGFARDLEAGRYRYDADSWTLLPVEDE